MPSPFVHVTQATAVNVPTTTETVVVTSDDVPLTMSGGEGVSVRGVVNMLAGTATTAVVLRVRQNTLTGTLVGVAQTFTLAAGATASIPYSVLDTTASTTPVSQYVVTMQQTAATGNGTANIATAEIVQATSEV